jgi:hypothetical protein
LQQGVQPRPLELWVLFSAFTGGCQLALSTDMDAFQVVHSHATPASESGIIPFIALSPHAASCINKFYCAEIPIACAFTGRIRIHKRPAVLAASQRRLEGAVMLSWSSDQAACDVSGSRKRRGPDCQRRQGFCERQLEWLGWLGWSVQPTSHMTLRERTKTSRVLGG